MYEICDPIVKSELNLVRVWIERLHNVMMRHKSAYGFGRAIAAPQIGIMKRLVYMNVDNIEHVFINPIILDKSNEMIELWDDCMSFPLLEVRLKRYYSIEMSYRNLNWELIKTSYQGNYSELLQHEIDHLDGILCISRAIDEKSFRWKTKSRIPDGTRL